MGESTRHFEEATLLDPRNANSLFQLAIWNYRPLRRYNDAARTLDTVLTWQLPNGPDYGSLKLDEVWDPLRREPRFEQILASVKQTISK